jgi:hypothetical protein
MQQSLVKLNIPLKKIKYNIWKTFKIAGLIVAEYSEFRTYNKDLKLWKLQSYLYCLLPYLVMVLNSEVSKINIDGLCYWNYCYIGYIISDFMCVTCQFQGANLSKTKKINIENVICNVIDNLY